jgi:hypothetical protein
MRLERRLLLILAGRLDQGGLEELRRLLGLRRMGRLTDREDAQFGSRDIVSDDHPAMTLELWRDEDKEDRWSISLDAMSGAGASEDAIALWRSRAEAAAAAVGLTVVEARSFPPEHQPDYQTEWRNENWLRTAYWDLPAQSLDELWPVLGLSASASPEEKRAELTKFVASPTWEAAPTRIRSEADAFLHGGEHHGGEHHGGEHHGGKHQEHG